MTYTGAAIAFQFLVLLIVSFKRGPTHGLILFALMLVLCLVVSELYSGHIVIAQHLLWVVPLARVAVVLYKARRHEVA